MASENRVLVVTDATRVWSTYYSFLWTSTYRKRVKNGHFRLGYICEARSRVTGLTSSVEVSERNRPRDRETQALRYLLNSDPDEQALLQHNLRRREQAHCSTAQVYLHLNARDVSRALPSPLRVWQTVSVPSS